MRTCTCMHNTQACWRCRRFTTIYRTCTYRMAREKMRVYMDGVVEAHTGMRIVHSSLKIYMELRLWRLRKIEKMYIYVRASVHMRRSPVRIRVHGFAGAHTYTRAYSRRSNPHSSYRSSQFSISDGRAVLSNSVKFLEIDNWIGTESIFEWARESRLI